MIRVARPDEFKPVCAQIATLRPWALLGINSDELVRGLQVDPLRTMLVYCEDERAGNVTGAVIIRERGAAELLFYRGFGASLAEQAGVEFPCEWTAVPDAGYIGSLGVFGETRRGIGQRLIDAAHERFATAGMTRALLMVSHFNFDAKRFYERNGYREIACLDDCLKAGNREHLMERVF